MNTSFLRQRGFNSYDCMYLLLQSENHPGGKESGGAPIKVDSSLVLQISDNQKMVGNYIYFSICMRVEAANLHHSYSD